MPRAFMIAALFAFIGAPAQAGSNAADYLVKEQIAEACDGGTGEIDPASVIEQDLTGDGKADLIIFHHGIDCLDRGRSLFCGAQACSIKFYVRRGALLAPAGEILGVETVAVGDEAIPAIRTFAHGGAPTSWKWNGAEFRSIGD